jgi:hypothetical protein
MGNCRHKKSYVIIVSCIWNIIGHNMPRLEHNRPDIGHNIPRVEHNRPYIGHNIPHV